MFRFTLHKPVIVTVAILIVSIFGVLAFFRAPVQMIPDLDPRVISIETRWAGASPQDIEQEILIEQEQYLRRIPGLTRMIATARTGRAEIELEFPHGTDLNETLIRVNNAVSQVPRYPENVDEPRISASSFSANAFMYFSVKPLPGNPAGIDIRKQRDFLEDNVLMFLERTPGVDSIGLFGGERRQIRILVDPVRLAERALRLTDVRNAIRARNRDVSGGDLDFGKRRYLLRTRGRFDSIEQIENLVIARRGETFIRLRDVGRVEQAGFEPRAFVYVNGEPVINLSVRRQTGANVIRVKQDMLAVVEELNRGLLKDRGLVMQLISEDARYVETSVKIVSQSLLLGALLATLVLFLFLRSGSATLAGALGIPVCALAAFLGLVLCGRTLNVISLAGVAFAIGMTLDNSIVVLENIYRHMALGKTRMQAALAGVREVWSAVLASTLTTVFVFLPIIFVREEAGQLYSDIAIAISASILMSMIVAITVIPVACSRFLKPNTGPPARLGVYRLGQGAGRLIMRLVDWLLAGLGRRVALILGVVGVALLILARLTPSAEYLPEGEEKKIFARIFAPPGYNIGEMHAIGRSVNAYYAPHVGQPPEAEPAGADALPPLDYIVMFANNSNTFYVVEVAERQHLDRLIALSEDYARQFPGMLGFVSRGSIFAGNSGGTRSINLDISGPDLQQLYALGLAAFLRAKEIFVEPRVRPEPSALTLGQPMIEIRPDWERAAELGIDADELGYAIWAYSDGAFVDEYFEDDRKIDMFLYSSAGAVRAPSDLQHLPLYAAGGGIVPLGAVAQVAEAVNTETIRRVDSRRAITLSIIPPRAVPLEEGVRIVQRDLIQHLKDAGALKNGLTLNISGASDRLNATREALQVNFLVAVLITYLLLVAIFSHWGYPLLIMSSVPIGISGGLVGLWLMNYLGARLPLIGLQGISQPFDMITMLGFLVLIGTVVNNPILLVERAMQNIRRRGMAIRAAVRESTAARLRPIMMSSITTVAGLSPLVLNPGAGAELYRGLGAIVLFGLLFSTLVTLTFMPCLMSLILEWAAPAGRKQRVAPPRPATAESD